MSNSDSRLTDDFSDEVEITNTSDYLRVAIEIAIAALILLGIYFLFAPEETINLPPPVKETQIDPVIRNQIEAAKVIENESQVISSAPEVEQTPQTNANDNSNQMDVVSAEPVTQATPTQANGSARSESQETSPIAETEQTPQSETKDNSRRINVASAEPLTQTSETAREVISKLRSGALSLTSAELIEKSEQFTRQGRLTDTYLLLFYAAREGDGQAAFALASLYDPRYFQEGNAILEKADVFQAHKWYREAAKQQIAEAKQRLENLRREIEKQAKSGDPSAQRLLLNWQ